MGHTRVVTPTQCPRTSQHPTLQLVLAALAITIAACSADDPTAGGADALESLTRQTQVTAGGSFEGNFIMKQGATVTCSFSTPSIALRWDVHTHVAGGEVLDSGVDRMTQIQFTAPSDGGYSILWENLDMVTTPLEISLTFDGDVQFHSWFPDN